MRGPTKHVSRPQVEADHASRGRPVTQDMHACECRGRRPWGMYACPRPRIYRGRGRRDRTRQEAKSNMLCARMTQPRFHKRLYVRTGPSCIQHRRDLRSNICMHERTYMHQNACCIIVEYK
eukprot:364812-Chlamydomonas_euryale.AAC.6